MFAENFGNKICNNGHSQTPQLATSSCVKIHAVHSQTREIRPKFGAVLLTESNPLGSLTEQF